MKVEFHFKTFFFCAWLWCHSLSRKLMVVFPLLPMEAAWTPFILKAAVTVSLLNYSGNCLFHGYGCTGILILTGHLLQIHFVQHFHHDQCCLIDHMCFLLIYSTLLHKMFKNAGQDNRIRIVILRLSLVSRLRVQAD